MGVITEKTSISVVVVSILLGAVLWITEIASTANSNERMIKDLKKSQHVDNQELKAYMLQLSEKLDKIQTTTQKDFRQIESRLSRIEEKVSY